MKRWWFPALLIFGLVMFLFSMTVIYSADNPLSKAETLTFTSQDGENLAGTYYPGDKPYGIILLEGFGSDQVTMRSAAREFASLGVHVFTFDFSGHGRSQGALAFDNAATDRLARQLLVAKSRFQNLSGLEDWQIVLLGHSLGARVALQAASMDANRVAGVILLGAQVSLIPNAQSEFFTGTSDAALPWVQALGPQNPATNIFLISGNWDDILTPTAASRLIAQLSGQKAISDGIVYGPHGMQREWLLIPGLLHNYEIFSGQVLEAAITRASAWWGLGPSTRVPAAARRLTLWISAIAGLVLALLGLSGMAARRWPQERFPNGVEITRLKRFMWSKLALWLAALPLIGLIFFASIQIPLGVPVYNLIYVGFIGGYGLLMLLLYSIGRMPGTQGKLQFTMKFGRVDYLRIVLALAFNLILLFALVWFARSGWFYTPPNGDRLIWVFIFAPVTALGFWFGQLEGDLISNTAPGRSLPQWLAGLNGLMPFFLWTILQAGLGSTSGMIGGLQGLLVLGIIILQGGITRRLTGLRWPGAICQALLLYLLVLPQGVLFSM
ncbi:MAG: alpha/beta hydrolase [Anaerolineaceae bacterium]|nr:alpha/beta hydrolase [Anaerolineaceae bacterium]